MLIKAACRPNTLNSIATGATFLPFLYTTRTIIRSYGDAFDDALTDKTSRPSTHYRTSPRYRRPHDNRPRQRDVRHNTRRGPRSTRQEQDNLDEQSSSPPSKPTNFIPFERPKQEDPYGDLELEGTTITPNERKAFESLFKLHGSNKMRKVTDPTQTDEKTGEKRSQSLDDILNAAVKDIHVSVDGRQESGVMPKALRALAGQQKDLEVVKNEAAEDEEQDERNLPISQAALLKTQAQLDIRRVRSMVNRARFDCEIHEILHREVLDRVRALELDGPDPSQAPNKKKSTKTASASSENLPTIIKVDPHHAPFTDLQILTHSLPTHLTFILNHLTSHYPQSHLALTLLPTLKSLGPTTAALGLSTALYNAHMRLLWSHYHSLSSIFSILEEMERDVYEFDNGTQALLVEILNDIRDVEVGVRGEGIRMLGQREGEKGRVRGLWFWIKTVERKRGEVALRRAQEMPVEAG